LPEFTSRLNEKFAVKPASEIDLHRPVEAQTSLERLSKNSSKLKNHQIWTIKTKAPIKKFPT